MLVIKFLKSVNFSLPVLDSLLQTTILLLSLVKLNFKFIDLKTDLLILLELVSDQLSNSVIEVVNVLALRSLLVILRLLQ